MPTYKHPFDKGSLFIQFSIEMPPPNSLSPTQIKELEAILPGRRPPAQDDEGTETVTLTGPISAQEQAHQRQQQQRREAYDEAEEEDGHPGASRVQCAQQ